MVVAGDVQMRPAGPRAAQTAIAQDALADVPEAAQLPGVEEQKLTSSARLDRTTVAAGAAAAAPN